MKLPFFKSKQTRPEMYAGQNFTPVSQRAVYTGERYPTHFGTTQEYRVDRRELRKKSHQVFLTNKYAQGLIRTILTAELGEGLNPESSVPSRILGLSDEASEQWGEDVESLFDIWASTPELCHYQGQHRFGTLQRMARGEAMVSGDVLVRLHWDEDTNIPKVELVSTHGLSSPYQDKQRANEIIDGVEIDSAGRHVAYHMLRKDGEGHDRIPAYGERSGHRVAWLLTATNDKLNGVRGLPVLHSIVSDLQEIDRCRDAVQRKMTLNAILSLFVKKEQPSMGSLPMTNSRINRNQVETTSHEETRRFDSMGYIPGLMIEELDVGEDIVAHAPNGADMNFGAFEAAILEAVSASLEFPPEMRALRFGNSFSAAQAAINRCTAYTNRVRTEFGSSFCGPIYSDCLYSAVLRKKIKAKEITANILGREYDVENYYAWFMAKWYGPTAPGPDPLKEVRAKQEAVNGGFCTHAKASRDLNGTKASRNFARLGHEMAGFSETRQQLNFEENGDRNENVVNQPDND